MKKNVRYAIDRKEGTLLVLIPDVGQKELFLNKNQYDLSVGDVVDVTFEGDAVVSVSLCEEETERRNSSMHSRLAALFAKGKKPKA